MAERGGDLMTRLDRAPSPGGSGPDPALTQTLGRMIEALPQVSLTLLTDPSGRIIAASQPLPDRHGQSPVSLASRASFQAVRDGPLKGGAALVVSRTAPGSPESARTGS